MMENVDVYLQKEEELFQRWKKNMKIKEENFCCDGLLYKGEIKRDESNKWYREPGNESELWDNSPLKILLFSKYPNDNYDIRSATGYNHKSNNKTVTNQFFKNLVIWVYGIYKRIIEESNISFGDLDEDEYINYWENKISIVRVNCSKILQDNDIIRFFDNNKYKKYIKEQLDLYNANFIYCCGRDKSLRYIIKKLFLSDFESVVGDWTYYSSSKKALLINGYSPSARFSFERMYEELMEKLNLSLEKRPIYQIQFKHQEDIKD